MTVPITPIDQTPPKAPSLESKAMRATAWTLVAYGASQALRLGNSMILSRMLVPDSFGLMALVSTLILGINLLSDIGVGDGVVQSPRGDDPVFLNTAWTVQAIRGIVLWVIALLITRPVVWFYHEPRLNLLLPVLAFSVVLGGFNGTSLLSLGRHMGVQRLYLLEFAAQVIQLSVTIGWAMIQPSVWALAGGSLVGNAFKLVASHMRWAFPGIRNRFLWDASSARSLIHFGRWILLGTACFFFASQADRLILGKLVSFAVLGVYGIAFSLSDIPRQVILMFCGRVGYPFIAKFSHLPRPEFRALFLRYRLLTLLAGAVLLALVVHLGGFVILKLYDRRYHDASWMIPILALGLWHTLLYSTTKPGLFCLSKTNYHAIGNVLYLIAMVVGLPFGFRVAGMLGVVIAVAAGDLPQYFANVYGASREGISCWAQDLKTTGIFLGLLLLGEAVRRTFV